MQNKISRAILAACLLVAALSFAVPGAVAQGKSAESYRVALAKNPSSAEYAVGLAQALYREGQHDQALQALKEFLDAYPDKVTARNEYAALLADSRRFDEALLQYREVLRTAPDNLRAQLGEAKVLSWQARFDDALLGYDRILASHPHYHDAMVGKAFTLLWMGRKDEATAAFLDAANTNPRDKEVAAQLRAMGITPPPLPRPRPEPAREKASSSKTSSKPRFPEVTDLAASGSGDTATAQETASDASSRNPRPWLWLMLAVLGSIALVTVVSIVRGLRQANVETTEGPEAVAGPRFTTVSTKPRGKSREPNERIPDLAKLKVEPKELTVPMLHQMQDSITAIIGYAQILDTKVEGEALEYLKKMYAQALRMQKLIEQLPKQSKAQADNAAGAGTHAPGAVSTSPRFKLRGRILLINESAATLHLQRSVLAGAGAELVAVTEVPAAVSLLGKERFDVVIVDADLSGSYSWTDVHEWLARHEPELASRMLLICPSSVSPELAERIQRERITSVPKPLDVKQLLSVTYTLLASAQPA